MAALEPDVASLISRGDSLVLQVQKLDLERALRVNATTGQLRSARSALKNSSEVSGQVVWRCLARSFSDSRWVNVCQRCDSQSAGQANAERRCAGQVGGSVKRIGFSAPVVRPMSLSVLEHV